MINFQKSSVYFSPNIVQDCRDLLKSNLGVIDMDCGGTYLGIPFMIGIRKCEIFSYIKARIWKKIHCWQYRMLSVAGREVMLKFVLQSLPAYAM